MSKVTTAWRIDCPKCGVVMLAEHRDNGRVFVVDYGDPRCMSIEEHAEWRRAALAPGSAGDTGGGA